MLVAGVSLVSPYLSTPQSCQRVVGPHANPSQELTELQLVVGHDAGVIHSSLQLATVHAETYCCPTLTALMLQLSGDNAFGLTQYDGFTSFFGGHPVMSQVQLQLL